MSEPKTWLEADAGKTAIIPVAGLLIGSIVGIALANIKGATDVTQLWTIVRGSVAGSHIGMGLAMVVAVGIRRCLTTVRGLAWLSVVTAIMLVFWNSVQ